MKDYSHYGPAYKDFIVKDDVFVPAPMEVFPADNPHTMMIKVRGHVRDLVFDDSYPYLDKSLKFRINRFFVYTVVRVIVFFVNRVYYGLRIEGRNHLWKNRRLFRDGAMTICNHIGRWDMISVLQATQHRSWIPMYRNSFMGKDGYLMKHVGGIPVPEDRSGLRCFNEAFDELHRRKQWMHIFPESCSWKYYSPVRPFKIGAFNMAYKYNIPIIPCVISFRERKGFFRIFRSDEPLMTIHIGEPVLPDINRPRKEEAARLREVCHAHMVEMAGIIHNTWPASID
ncbi:MAG: 1-acyl-sn-glycerol-3-phosphate acyltransferase [Paludibacteraceae bacterium]|nr:1-acyl-sn-glycerol-3-phosphate acyltransferase [Paludibacteraceae bacterium]